MNNRFSVIEYNAYRLRCPVPNLLFVFTASNDTVLSLNNRTNTCSTFLKDHKIALPYSPARCLKEERAPVLPGALSSLLVKA